MLFNYFRVALRNLRKNRSYVIINTLGMGTSLACFITAYFLAAFNMEFDDFHDDEKVSRIFSVHTLAKEKDGTKIRDVVAPMVLLPIASQEITGVDRYTRFLHGGGSLSHGDKAFNEGVAFADSTFFDLFDFPLVSGNHTFFHEKDQIFISEAIAEKYFGDDDPIGKLMVFSGGNGVEIELLVGGVVKAFPINNSFFFDILIRIEHLIDMHAIKNDDWGSRKDPSTFVELSSADQAAHVSAEFSKYIVYPNSLRTGVEVESYELVPFKSNFSWDDVRLSRLVHRKPARSFLASGLMAVLILIIAGFNLANTTFAMACGRLKEVGVRKAVGAMRRQIVLQFLFETLLLVAISIPVGLLLAKVVVPAYVRMWNMRFDYADLDGLNLLIAVVLLVFVTSLLAGIYPALYSSKLRPTALLNSTVRLKGNNGLTRTMVGIQFALSVVVMVAGIVFVRNIKYQEQINFGYDYRDVINVSVGSEKQFEAMRNAIDINTQVVSVSASHGTLGGGTSTASIKVGTTEHEAQVLPVGENYFKTMGFRFVEGRPFNFEQASDLGEGLIVNQAFVALADVDDPIDHIVVLHNVKRRIVGVIENHVDNLFRSKDPEPFVFLPLEKDQYNTLLVKTHPGQLAKTQRYLESTWKEMFPGVPFESRSQYDILFFFMKRKNINMGKMFLFISVLGALLAGAGIYAMASLNVARRRKEIGIRRTFGASVNSILGLMNLEFLITLLLAGIAGSIGGYHLTDSLLSEEFSHRISVGAMPLIVSAVFLFAVGIFTTSMAILKAAKANPVNSLRTG